MHTHPAKHLSTVAINALWCILIALTLLALPIIARQIRLQTSFAPASTPAAAAPQDNAPNAASGAILLTQSDAPSSSR